MKFLEKTITEILQHHPNLEEVTLVIPGKRPHLFIKKIIAEKEYSGFLPDTFTIQEFISQIAQVQEINGIALWLFAYNIYVQKFPEETLHQFLKWFPTLVNDWDDMLKYAGHEKQILDYMLAEERIKNWGENLGDEHKARKRNLNFWRKMQVYIPLLRSELEAQALYTSGMLSQKALQNLDHYSQNLKGKIYFIGFNAFSGTEEKLVKYLIKSGQANCIFHADRYYMEDQRQEAGLFLRKYKQWSSQGNNFKYIEDDFVTSKNINVYEVPGNVTQAKLLPTLLSKYPDVKDTAVVLLDETLLPATLDALQSVDAINITMGFPIKNFAFSQIVKQIIYLQKQLEKNPKSHFYKDLLPILQDLPTNDKDKELVEHFLIQVETQNLIYIKKSVVEEKLSATAIYPLLLPQQADLLIGEFLHYFIQTKTSHLQDDILYETISHFEKNFVILQNLIQEYNSTIDLDTLEILIHQLIQSATINFQGEPLQGLQVMGLLETRLLNFKNLILLSANEGKLPSTSFSNSYLPYNVRAEFGLPTFVEGDSIYAYHFYRLLQDSENVEILFNSLSSGINTGEKSRFITQIDLESPHQLNYTIVDNAALPVEATPIIIKKNLATLQSLAEWKNKVSVSHLTTYLYSPYQFYLEHILKIKSKNEMEEELSSRNFGNLVHYSLEWLYKNLRGKILTEKDLKQALLQKDIAIQKAIEKLNHQPTYYEKGMNYIHKSLAEKVIENMVRYDLDLVQNGAALEILEIEKRFENVELPLDDSAENKVMLKGFIDRIDRLDGEIRIIDYKTGAVENLILKLNESNRDTLFRNSKYKQAMQLSVYQYVAEKLPDFRGSPIQTYIWSFGAVQKGPESLVYKSGNQEDAIYSVKQLILEILNPAIDFEEHLPDAIAETETSV